MTPTKTYFDDALGRGWYALPGDEYPDPPLCFKCKGYDTTYLSIELSPDESRPWCPECLMARCAEEPHGGAPAGEEPATAEECEYCGRLRDD